MDVETKTRLKHPGLADRLTPNNPGPLAPCGTVRGIFTTMLERYDLEEVRNFWRRLPIVVRGTPMGEADGYRHLWEDQGLVHVHYLEAVNAALQDFLFSKGLSHFRFYDEMHFRFKQGGMWSAKDSLVWIKDLLPKLYSESDPKIILLRLVCEWGMRAIPGAACDLHSLEIGASQVSAIYSFAPDGTFSYRCPFLFSRSTMLGMQMFPKFLGLTAFEETRLLADCLHPDDIIRNAEWSIRDGAFYIDGIRKGAVVPFSEWALRQGFRYDGNPIPEREVILMEEDWHCMVQGIPALLKGCIYDAPLFLAHIRFCRNSQGEGEVNPDFLANIVKGLSLSDSPEWLALEAKYAALLRMAGETAVFEYVRSSQLMLVNGKTLIAGVPAMILRKALAGWVKGRTRFDFRAFKHDTEIFADSKRTSFETRWNRLREKLVSDFPRLVLEKTGKGEFMIKAECAIDFRELP